MSKNNHIELIGNLGAEVRTLKLPKKKAMSAFSLATQDSYKDKEDNWVNLDTVWHNVLCFKASEVKKLSGFKKGDRIKVIGSLSYKEIEAIVGEGETRKIREASVIASKVELAPLVPSSQ